MRSRSRLALLLVGPSALALALLSAPAQAVPSYPGKIGDYFTPHLDYTPPCRLCHIEGTTGSGTVQTPFGVSMLAQGMTGERNTLTPALDALGAGNVDSDGDGVSDLDELRANTDPNTPADVPLSPSTPSYGCSVAPAWSARDRCSLVGGAVLAMALALGRRGRGKSSR